MKTKRAYNLERFLKAQEQMYSVALSKIRAGKKESHWMWFIFSQLRVLGFSPTAQYYGIANLAEAQAYLGHPVLRHRLIEISEALLALEYAVPTHVMGHPDDLKLCSSMTLFDAADPAIPIFARVLDKFYAGTRDKRTLTAVQVPHCS